MIRAASAVTLLSCLLVSSCGSAPGVPRRNGDTIEMGRHIPPQAYAWYARGLYFERNGHVQEAELAYQSALDLDRRSGSAWASLVRVRCHQSDDKALEAAAQGLSRAVRLAPILSERARCLLDTWSKRLPEEKAKRLVEQALGDARAAVNHEPSYPPANQLVVEIYQALSQRAQAEAWERAYELYTGYPLSFEQGQETGVDTLLAAGEFDLARRRAVGTITPGELAVRAYALNRHDLAKQQAEMTLLASPNDADAQLIMYLTAEEPRASMSHEFTGELSELGAIVFTLHLNRTAGLGPAREFWLKYAPKLGVTLDPLARSLLENLKLN